MSKPDWKGLQSQFTAAHARSGIKLEDWCEENGLTYNTARRHIKKTAQKNAQTKTAQKPAQKSRQVVTEGKKKNPVVEVTPAESKENFFQWNPHDFGLSEQQGKFSEFVADGKSRIDAYRLADYAGEGNTAYVNASRMLRNAKVRRAVDHLRSLRQKRYTAELDEIVHQLVAITRADPNELMQYRRVNCRYCWGENFLYQWRDIDEFDKAATKASNEDKKEPEYGGLGFIATMDPNPDCPKCFGEGNGDIHIADTRDHEGDARYLFEGVKQTKFGVEILTASKSESRREIVKIVQGRNPAAGGTGIPVVRSYTPEDYRAASSRLDDEFEDLD